MLCKKIEVDIERRVVEPEAGTPGVGELTAGVVELPCTIELDEEDTEQSGTVTRFESKVTVADIPNAPLIRDALVSKVTEAPAIMVPAKDVPVPSVAAEPTAQYTRHAFPPLTKMTAAADAVVNAFPIWKYHWSFGDPVPFSVNVPVS